MTDDLPKVITIGRLRFKRRGQWRRWAAGYPSGELSCCDGRWGYVSHDGLYHSALAHETPREAYLAGLHNALDTLERRYQSEHARLIGLLREARGEK